MSKLRPPDFGFAPVTVNNRFGRRLGDWRHRHLVLEHGDTSETNDASYASPDWYRDWVILPKLSYAVDDNGIWTELDHNDHAPWHFVLVPTSDHHIDHEKSKAGIRRHRSGWTLCRTPLDILSRDLSGPAFDRHRLRNALIRLRGLYIEECPGCYLVMRDMFGDERL